jgi:hypothetical protein
MSSSLARRLASQAAVLQMKVDKYEEYLRRLMKETPHESVKQEIKDLLGPNVKKG